MPSSRPRSKIDSHPSVLDYTYLLFWNSFWTIAPVIGIGLFDRIAGMSFLTLVSVFVSPIE